MMISSYHSPDNLHHTQRVAASISFEFRQIEQRLWAMRLQGIFFATIFALLVFIETMLAAMMFSLIQIEILGSAISGAAFALLVPIVITAVHIKLHHEGDHFTKWWLGRLSGVGILMFALGVSLMVGFSAWQAAEDALSLLSSGPVGVLGDEDVQSGQDAPSGVFGLFAGIPQAILFIGLSFGMIITIYVASFCLGRALEAYNFLILTPRPDPEMRRHAEALGKATAELRKLRDEDAYQRQRLPFDPKHKFAREAANAVFETAQIKRRAARRKFDPMRHDDPLAGVAPDAEAATIPSQFETEANFTRHLNDQIDAMRIHNLLRILSGLPEKEDRNVTQS